MSGALDFSESRDDVFKFCTVRTCLEIPNLDFQMKEEEMLYWISQSAIAMS